MRKPNIIPTSQHPMMQDRATKMFGRVFHKLTRDGRMVIDKDLTDPERVEVEQERRHMLRSIAQTLGTVDRDGNVTAISVLGRRFLHASGDVSPRLRSWRPTEQSMAATAG